VDRPDCPASQGLAAYQTASKLNAGSRYRLNRDRQEISKRIVIPQSRLGFPPLASAIGQHEKSPTIKSIP